MCDLGKSALVFDWKALGKTESRLRLYQTQRFKRRNLLELLQKRELYGPQRHLSDMRCRVAVDSMQHPKLRSSSGILDSYMKYTLLMGLSTDSAYALCLVVPDVCSFDRFLVIANVTPTALVPRFAVCVRERRAIDNFYASFSRDSSIISVIVSPRLPSTDKLEPYFFDSNIYLLNLKHALSVEMCATIRASCRWSKRKLDRVCLRSTDYGAVLNSGHSITALIFISSLPAGLDLSKVKAFRLKYTVNAGYERSGENLESSIVIHGARKLNRFYLGSSQEDEYSFELIKNSEEISGNNGKEVYFLMSITDIASFLKIGTSKLLRYFFCFGQVRCVDYELDIIECSPDFWINSLVTSLIEVKINGITSTYVGVFAVKTNALTKLSDVSVWKKLRAVDAADVNGGIFPYKRDKWYPFGDRRGRSIEERIISDECLSTGQSACLLSSPFPGIELEKTVFC